MPEGDTVFVAATRLNDALADRAITRSDLRVPRYATVDLAGRVVRAVVSRGKHLFFHLDDDLVLHTHFKMDGMWHLYRAGERWRAPARQVRAVLETAGCVAVGFRLPVIELVSEQSARGIVAHLGPDPLTNWDEEEALRRLVARAESSLGEVLLDQSVMAGLGNVYKSEVCFLRGLDPRRRVGDVDDPRAVVRLSKRLLEANRTIGRQITTGDTRPGRTSWVYGRAGDPCRRCGTTIEKQNQPGYGADRVTYWCRRCQL